MNSGKLIARDYPLRKLSDTEIGPHQHPKDGKPMLALKYNIRCVTHSTTSGAVSSVKKSNCAQDALGCGMNQQFAVLPLQNRLKAFVLARDCGYGPFCIHLFHPPTFCDHVAGGRQDLRCLLCEASNIGAVVSSVETLTPC